MKKIQQNILTGKMDLDSSLENVAVTDYRNARNFDNNNSTISTVGQGSNVLGNTKPSNSYTDGKVVGRAKYEKENAEIVFVRINGEDDEIRIVTEDLVQVILKAPWLEFEHKLLNNPVVHEDTLVWVQENKEPRSFNIQWMKRYSEYILFPYVEGAPFRIIKSFSEWDGTLDAPPALQTILYQGDVWLADAQNPVKIPDDSDPDWTLYISDYDQVYREVTEETIQLIARPPLRAIEANYGTDEVFSSNNLYGKLYQFAYKYEYIDGRQSVYSSLSQVDYPTDDETSTGVKTDLLVNNVIDLTFYTGNRTVSKIHIAAIDSSDPSSVKIIETISKYKEDGTINSINGNYLTSDTNFTFRGFYNNEQYIAETINELYRVHDYVPTIARTQEVLNDGRMLFGDVDEYSSQAEVIMSAATREEAVIFTTGTVYAVTKNSYSQSYPTAGVPSTVYMDVFSVNFASNYKAGLVFQYNIEIKSTDGTSISPALNEVRSIKLPFNVNLTENENRLIGMKVIADKIRQEVHDYAKYHYVNPSSATDPTWFVSQNRVDWSQYPAYYPDDNDTQNGQYPRMTAAHRGDTLYPSVPFTKSDDQIVIMQKALVTERYDALFPFELQINLSSVSIVDPSTPVYETLKSNSRINLGLIYKDKNLRKTGVLGKVSLDTGFGYTGISQFSNYSHTTFKPIMSINSVPPTDAHYYSFVVGENVIMSDYLQIPVAVVDTVPTTEIGLGVNSIVTDRLDANGKLIVNPWVFEPLDRIRFKAVRTADNSYTFEERFDTEILYEDSGNFYIETQGAFNPVVGDLIEIYRLKKGVDSEDDVYFEIGGLLEGNFEILDPGTNTRRHSGNESDQTVSYDPATGTTSLTPAESVLNYGNSFLKVQSSIDNIAGTIYTHVVQSKYFSDYYFSDFYDNGKPEFILEEESDYEKDSLLRFGGKLLPETNLNFIARFTYEDYRSLSKNYGKISGLRSKGDTILVWQRSKVTSFYVNKTIIKDAGSGEQIALEEKILNNLSPSPFDYGCINPESIIKKGTHILFFDAINGAFVRIANNGMYPISDYGVASFAKWVGDGVLDNGEFRFDIIGQYNERNDRFYFSINREIDDNPENDYFETISFDDKKNEWKSFHDFTKGGVGVEMLGSVNNFMTAYINGETFVFSSDSYNTLFDEAKVTQVTPVINSDIGIIKILNYLTIDANGEWIPNEDEDISVDDGAMVSKIRLLRLIEGRYHSDFKRNMLYPNGSARPNENLGEPLRGYAAEVTLRTSGNTKKTITSVIFGLTLSEKII
jgi:hypothetical protein